MFSLYENPLYMQDISECSSWNVPWSLLHNRTVLISGGTGLIGSFLVDVIMHMNKTQELNCSLVIMCRNAMRAEERFYIYKNNTLLNIIEHDVSVPLKIESPCDYVLHLASNTHPLAYAEWPIETITSNIYGTKNMLDYAVAKKCSRFLLASSNEIYGENQGDTEFFDEDYCGYINCNTLRAGYTESKRCSESLCQAYIKQKNSDCVIARLTRSYGPTIKMDDSKALSQFLKCALNKTDIILKSEGNQFYSFTYVADAVQGLLAVLLKGKNGEAYNIADASSDITLKDLACLIAKKSNVNVKNALPDAGEAQGFSKVTKARLDGSKIKELGWNCNFPIEKGIEHTLRILGRE